MFKFNDCLENAMANTEKMKCPDCGVDMNHHADKMDYTAGFGDTDGVDAEFGGVVAEVHTCPGCGKTALRIEGSAAERFRL